LMSELLLLLVMRMFYLRLRLRVRIDYELVICSVVNSVLYLKVL
jgi:hypothetical protein